MTVTYGTMVRDKCFSTVSHIHTYIHVYVTKNPGTVIGEHNMKLVTMRQHIHTKNSKHE